MSLIAILDRLDRAYFQIAPVGLGFLGACSAYYVALSYGSIVAVLVLGSPKATYYLKDPTGNPTLVLVLLPVIPVFLVGVEALDIEGRILMLWRSSISRWVSSTWLVGSVVEWIWPTPTRQPLISTQEGLTGSVDYFVRSLCAGLLIPFFAYTIGLVLRPFIKTQPGRTIIGGVIFFSLKTLFKVYLRQQEYRRQGSRRVLDYTP